MSVHESVGVTEAGPGDWIKVGGVWKRIKWNSAYRADPLPRLWRVETVGGETFGMYDIELYGKGEPL